MKQKQIFSIEKAAILRSSISWEKTKVLRAAGRKFPPRSAETFYFERRKAENANFPEINVLTTHETV